MARPNPPSLEDLLDICRIKCKTPNPEFVRLFKGLFSKAPYESDEAFWALQWHATEFFEELVSVFEPIRDELAVRDHDTHNWYYHALLDCISQAANPKVLTILYHELRHPHPRARQIAIWNLKHIGNHDKEGRKILRNALKNELSTDKETWEFREAVQKALKNED